MATAAARRYAKAVFELARHCILQPVDLSDAVAYGHDAAHVSRHQARVEILEPLFDDLRNFFGAYAHSLFS